MLSPEAIRGLQETAAKSPSHSSLAASVEVFSDGSGVPKTPCGRERPRGFCQSTKSEESWTPAQNDQMKGTVFFTHSQKIQPRCQIPVRDSPPATDSASRFKTVGSFFRYILNFWEVVEKNPEIFVLPLPALGKPQIITAGGLDNSHEAVGSCETEATTFGHQRLRWRLNLQG